MLSCTRGVLVAIWCQQDTSHSVLAKINSSVKKAKQSPGKGCHHDCWKSQVQCSTICKLVYSSRDDPTRQTSVGGISIEKGIYLLRRGKCDPSEAEVSALPREYLTVGVPVIRECEFSHVNMPDISLSFSLKIFLELEVCAFFIFFPASPSNEWQPPHPNSQASPKVAMQPARLAHYESTINKRIRAA